MLARTLCDWSECSKYHGRFTKVFIEHRIKSGNTIASSDRARIEYQFHTTVRESTPIIFNWDKQIAEVNLIEGAYHVWGGGHNGGDHASGVRLYYDLLHFTNSFPDSPPPFHIERYCY